MRLSDAEREALLAALVRHATSGRLDPAELETRTERVLRATDDAEAHAALADLPPLPATPPGAPAAAGRGRGRGRGHGEAATPHPDWQPTAERFRDPRSGRIMRVWIDSAGGRRYLPDAD